METVDAGDLVILDHFEQALAEATTVDKVRAIRNKADTVCHLAKHARMSLEIQNRAAEVKLRAERKAGRLLAQMKLRGGDRKSRARGQRQTLADFGITQSESKRWQREASVSEEDFQYYVRRAREFGEELTAAGLLRLARQVKKRRAVDSGSLGPSDCSGCANGRVAGQRSRADRAADGGAEPDGRSRAIAAECPPHRSAEEFDRLLSDLISHHSLLCQMLAPICEGEQQAWLPGQRRGTWHYLSEIGRLLVQLAPIEPVGEEQEQEQEQEPEQEQEQETEDG